MFTRDKPQAARDFSELTGDPWITGAVSDAPDPQAVNSDLMKYDQHLDNATMAAGVAPGSPGWEPVRSAIEAQHMIGPKHGEYPRHGDPLPMSAREFIGNSPQSTRDVFTEQSAASDRMLAEYQSRYPDLANDLEGMSQAVDVAMEYANERGERPMDNPTKFLADVAAFHRSGVRPYRSPDYSDHGRTAGVGSGGGSYIPDGERPDHPDNAGGLISEIRALQKSGGFF